MRNLSLFFPILLLFSSCVQREVVESPPHIRESAYEIAEKYIGMEYEWGGQDHWTTKGIDCSGLVVNVYKEAVESTPYDLQFFDAAVVNLYNQYSARIFQPEKGDLIFMGDDGISHVALFEKNENDTVYFIDAYSSGDGEVMYRNYPADSDKIKSYGRLLVYY